MTDAEEQVRRYVADAYASLDTAEARENRGRAPANSHRRLHAFVAVAAACAVAVTTGVLATSDSPGGRSIVAGGSPSTEIVARVTGEGAGVVVLSPSGKVTRTIAHGPQYEHWGGASVPADGNAIYTTIADSTADASCTDIGALPQVARVPVTGGAPQPLARGAGPVVSADGRWLAYLPRSECPTPESPSRSQDPTVEVMNLSTGDISRPFRRDPTRVINPIAWSNDGSKLFAAGQDRDADGLWDTLVVDPAKPDDKPTVVDVDRAHEVDNGAFLSDGHLVVAVGTSDGYRFVRVDQEGRVDKELFKTSFVEDRLFARGRRGTLRAGTGATLTSDANDRLLLAYDNGIIQTWNPGDKRATTVVPADSRVETNGAAWLSSQDKTPQLTTTSTTSEPPADRPGWARHDDAFHGFAVDVPDDWIEDRSALPMLLSASAPELVELCSGTVRTNVAFVTVNEVRSSTDGSVAAPSAMPRPALFGADSGSLQTPVAITDGCDEVTAPTQMIFFTEGGRTFQASVRLYPEASAQRRAEAYEMLNSTEFVPADVLAQSRPSAEEVRVEVRNGSGHPGAISAARSTLGINRYTLSGHEKTAHRRHTSVTCRAGYKAHEAELTRILQIQIRGESPVESAHKVPPGADCVVILGADAPFSIPQG